MKIRGTTITTPLARTAVPDDSAVSKKPWSSKNTVDKLCPSFSESGSVVVCEPLEGYPLEVVSEFEDIDSVQQKITLTQSGKNLVGLATVTYTTGSGTYNPTISGDDFILSKSVYYLNLKGLDKFLKAGQTYTFSIGGVSCNVSDFGWQIATADGNVTTPNYSKKKTVTVDAANPITAAVFVLGYPNKQDTDIVVSNIQIEFGSVVTPYEPYKEPQIFTVDLTNAIDVEEYGAFAAGSYNWKTCVLDTESGQFQHNLEDNSFTEIATNTYVPSVVRNIPAMSGTNAFYSNCGDTTVKGKSDPTAIIEKLTNAILALGGNV